MADLEDLISRLVLHNVDFVVIGGLAAEIHGVTLVTQDIDICCDFSAENLARLQAALNDLHPVHRIASGVRGLGSVAEAASVQGSARARCTASTGTRSSTFDTAPPTSGPLHR